ncbi:MAG: NADH dehydrogenase ubiquinone Fe-S protein 4 [Bdellovibrionales bacterium]
MRVRIYQPAKPAMQSHCSCDKRWIVEPLLALQREIDPVMGWVQADDPLSTLFHRLTFATSGEALTFVRSRGWDYDLELPNERRVVPKNYLDNFNPDRRGRGR